ncbi:hypothetical protein Tco_0535665 [Tanacetum coccineum]
MSTRVKNNLSRVIREVEIISLTKQRRELRSCDEVMIREIARMRRSIKRTKVLNKIHQVYNIQLRKIAQKARLIWAIEGDEIVKFVQGIANKKRNHLNLRGIMVIWDVVDDPVQVNVKSFEHFRERGSDGFSFSFYRHFWPVIEKDVFEAVDYFFMYGEIPNGCNSNFIALIPKILMHMFEFWIVFSGASGLRINMCKSKIMGVNVEDGMVKNAASKLGCLVLKTPFTYLGTKVGGNMSRKQAWKEVVDKVLSRLSRWKMKLLSIGGRLTLLKSVRFFNGQDPKSNKASWVKWNKVLTPKDKGGLGVSSLFALNRGRNFEHRMFSGGVELWTSIVHERKGVTRIGVSNDSVYIRLKLGTWGEHAVLGRNNWYEGGVIQRAVHKKREVGLNESNLTLWLRFLRMTTLVPAEDRYVWTLENDGVFSVRFQFEKEIDGYRFQDVSYATRQEYALKISSWWNIDYSDVNSYEEWQVWLVSIRIQSKLKGVLEGVYYGLWWYMWNFRNKLLFDKKIPEKALIFDNLVFSSFYWCKFRCKASFKWDDWLKKPYIVLV